MKSFLRISLVLLCSCISTFGQAISSVGTIGTNQVGVFLDAKHLKGATMGAGSSFDGTTFTFGIGTNASIIGVNGTQINGPNFTNSLGMVWGSAGTNVTGFPTNIADAQIVSGAAIARSKIANGTADHIVINSGAGALSSEATLGAVRFPALTGDITTPGGSLATSLAANSVTDTKLRDSVGFSVIGKATTGTGDPADIVAGTDTVFGRIGSGNLGFSKVNTNQISGANASAGQVLGFDGALVVWTNAPGGSGGGTNVSVNGVLPTAQVNLTNSTDITFSLAGASNTTASIASGAITDAKVNASGITTRSKLPTPIAYEDEDNSLSGSNLFTGSLRVTGSYQYGWTDLGASTNVTGATNALFKILTANLILTNSIRANENVRLQITQDATGSRTLSIDNVSSWVFNTNQSSTMPTVNTNAGRTTIIDLWRANGTNYGALVSASSVFSGALNDILPTSTGGRLIGFNTNSATPTEIQLGPNTLISNSVFYAYGTGAAGNSSSINGVTPSQLNLTNNPSITFSLTGTNGTAALTSGVQSTNQGFYGPMVFPISGTDSTNANWAVGQFVVQGITTNASFTNKFTGTNPVAGASLTYVVYNSAGTNISVIFDAQGAIGLTNYNYDTGTSNVTSVTVSAGTRTTFYWYYDGTRYYLNPVGKNIKVTDAVFSSSWDGDTGTAPSRNAVYDYFHLFIPGDNGKINLSGQTTNSGTILTPKVNQLVVGTNLIIDLSLSHYFDVLLTNANPALLSFTNSPGTNNLAAYTINFFQDSSGSRILNATNLLSLSGHPAFGVYTNAGGWSVLTVLPNPRTNGYYGGVLVTNL